MAVLDRAKEYFGRAAGRKPRLTSHASRITHHDSVVDGELLRKLERLSLNIGRDLISGLMGEHQAQRRTTGIEFADYRQYTTGDDLRRVDWNAYARLGTLMVKQAQAEHDTMLYLLVDASPSMEFGEPSKFLAARRLAAGLGYVALAHLDTLVLDAPGATSATRRNGVHRVQGRAEATNLFRFLQDLEPGSAIDFDNLLATWSTGRGHGRIAVIISDLLVDNWRTGVRQLVAAGFGVAVLHMLSPEELAPPDNGDLELIDSETGQKLELHLSNNSLAEYRRRVEAWRAEIEAWCATHGANYLLVQSDWDVERVMLDILRRRGVTA